MNTIESVECFKNCTKLCKPHESNKAMWEIYNKLDEKTEKDLLREQQIVKEKIKHPEFI